MRNDPYEPLVPTSLTSQLEMAKDTAVLERLSFLRRSATSIEGSISELSEALKILRSRHAALRQTLAAVNMLPAEVLQRIFLISHNDVETASWRPSHARTISSVCRRWRAVALTQSELWTTILLDGAEPTMRLTVERAGNRPFQVTHTLKMQQTTSIPKIWITSDVVPLSRWRSLSMAVKAGSTSMKAFHKIRKGLTNLESLTIDAERKYRTPFLTMLPPDLDLATTFPRLQSLHVMSAPVAVCRSALTASLVNLRLDLSVTLSDIITIFDSCQSLRRLWLSPAADAGNAFGQNPHAGDIVDEDHDADEDVGGDNDGDEAMEVDLELPATAATSASTRTSRREVEDLVAPPEFESLVLEEEVGLYLTQRIIETLRAPSLKHLDILLDPDEEPDLDDHRLFPPHLVSDFIQRFLSNLPHLESLVMTAHPSIMARAFDALIPVDFHSSIGIDTSSTHPTSGSSRFSAPALLDLELGSVAHTHADVHSRFVDYLGSVGDNLDNAVSSRASPRKCLRLLRVPGLTDEEVTRLSRVVWDVRGDDEYTPPSGFDIL
ncbi:hypothetical protein DL93DRAFT_2166792 [Clavulina sp. PMI_390]|nr:hypothetical protein DL93DRAFT_2166792 [Clavulina sp. PMI_390]